MIATMNPRVARLSILVFCVLGLAFGFLYAYRDSPTASRLLQTIPILSDDKSHSSNRPVTDKKPEGPPPPKYKPLPKNPSPLITDPFPLLATTSKDVLPPPIPAYNVPHPDLHHRYGLSRPPPLFIGFTRQWPMLLQAVVSYITAGWPASGIYVVENTGVHNSNRAGRLSLQNPFFLNHTTLRRLGVNVIQTPVLLNFAQMQNFFLDVAYQEDHKYYFYSHQDVLVFSLEDGSDQEHRPGDREWDTYDEEDKKATVLNPSAAGEEGYRTIYENCLREINTTATRKEKWGFRWFQYDHLTLVNRAALEAVGGWDSMIPYYGTDCDMNGKLGMDGWTTKHRRVGIINDVSSVMADLEALYRNPAITPGFVDPNPLPPDQEASIKEKSKWKVKEGSNGEKAYSNTTAMPTDPKAYFRILNQVGIDMGAHKYRDGDHQRNRWQKSQQGGLGEPYYYDPEGFARAFQLLTGAGMRIYTEKWGHQGCDVAEKTQLKLQDQWRVENDFE